MSMILDALKRSQRDTLAIRQDREVAVDDSPVTHGKSGASTTSLMLAVGLVIVALLAALLVLQLRPTAPPLASRFEDPSESTIPVPSAKDVTAVEQAPNSIATVRQKMVATKPPGTGEAHETVTVSPMADLASVDAAELSAKAAAVNNLYASQHARIEPPTLADGQSAVDVAKKNPSPSDDEVFDIADLVRRAQGNLGEAMLVAHPTPLLDTLSQQQKNAIPTIIYSTHEWTDGTGGEVTLNGEALTVGDRHGGFRVQDILSDSVVLRWGSTEFRLRALNSWINL